MAVYFIHHMFFSNLLFYLENHFAVYPVNHQSIEMMHLVNIEQTLIYLNEKFLLVATRTR